MPSTQELEAQLASLYKESDIEWGIFYNDAPKGVNPIDVIVNPQAAKGIFGHYGVSGDKLVRRRVLAWETIEEKP